MSYTGPLALGLNDSKPNTIVPNNATILAVVIGNALEWYEIVVYGYMAAIIARLFFPSHDAGNSLLLAFASFGLTYLSRPLGAVVLGVYADRFGRKTALQASIWMMVIASAAIAFVPTYDSIGIAAPVIVVLSRLLQGFAVGGEFGSATAFLAEQGVARRGYVASWLAAPMMVAQRSGLIIFTSGSGGVHYAFGPAYGAQKAGVDKLAADMAVDLRPHDVAVMSIWMGVLLTERVNILIEKDPARYGKLADNAETPELTGHIIWALYNDPDLMAMSGETLIGAEMARIELVEG